MPYGIPGQGFDQGGAAQNFVGGFEQGMNNALDRQLKQQQIQAGQEALSNEKVDRAYALQQRGVQQELQNFNLNLNKAARAFVGSDGLDYQPLLDVHNNLYPNAKKLAITPGQQPGTYMLNVTDDQGNQIGQPQPMSKQDLRQFGATLVSGMSNPEQYMANRFGLQKGRYTTTMNGDGNIVTTDTATGHTSVQQGGLGLPGSARSKRIADMNNDEVNQNRQLTNDGITKVIMPKFGGTFDTMQQKWTNDDPEKARKAMMASEILSQYIQDGQKKNYAKAASQAIRDVEAGILPQSQWQATMFPNGKPAINDGRGFRLATAAEIKMLARKGITGLPTGTADANAAPAAPAPARGIPPASTNQTIAKPQTGMDYFNALRKMPQNQNLSDQDIMNYVRSKGFTDLQTGQ